MAYHGIANKKPHQSKTLCTFQVIRLAKQHFNLDKLNIEVVNQDALHFLRKAGSENLKKFGLLIERLVRLGIRKVVSEIHEAEEFEHNKRNYVSHPAKYREYSRKHHRSYCILHTISLAEKKGKLHGNFTFTTSASRCFTINDS